MNNAGWAPKAKRTATALRQHADLLLQAGETERAFDELSQAAALDPADARVWSDLAAAHLQRSSELKDGYEIVLALSAANRAVDRDPTLAAARFNRALALKRLSLRADAAEEWRSFRRYERDASWSREARRDEAAVTDPAGMHEGEAPAQAFEQAFGRGDSRQVRRLVASFPQQLREYAEETLLPAWAAAEKARRDSDARRFLATARAVADGMGKDGDPMLAATLAQIERLRTATPRRFKRLVGGFVEYGKGLALVQQGDFFRALGRFRAAEGALAAQDSPFAGWATFQLALCRYQLTDTREARAELRALTSDGAKSRYKALQGRSLLLLGLMDVIEGNPTAAYAELESAISAFQSVRERAFVAKVQSLVASALDALGQRAEAWRRIYPALLEPEARYQPKIRSTICEVASFMAREQGDPDIALSFQGELLRNAYAPFATIEALRGRVGLLATLGRRSEASHDLMVARHLLQTIPGESRRVLAGDLWLAEAELAGTASAPEALAAIGKALAVFRDTSYHYRLSEVFFQRGVVERSLGLGKAAERDLTAALKEAEHQRKRIESFQERISFFDRIRDILDEMIALQVASGRSKEALRFSEQAKARVLGDWILAQAVDGPGLPTLPLPAPSSLEIASLLRSLPSRTVVLHYAVLPQTTVLWVLRQGEEPRVVTIAAGDKDLSERIAALHRALQERGKYQVVSAGLYDLLIAPIEHDLRPGERLVLVPDQALHRLSYATLWNRRTGRYLVQDHVLAVAPSLRVFAASVRRDAALRQVPKVRALVVSNPKFDLTLYGWLPRLSAEAAATTDSAVTRSFPGSRVIQGEGATQGAFLRAAGDFEILHFGGHSVINPELPLLSQMLFAREPGDPARGVLYSREILKQRFPRTRLAVLASCGTAQGRITRTEGVESLARPFLASGIPAVIASLWSVGDQSAAELFARFYTHLRSGFDAAAALRFAQLDAIENGGSGNPESWGAFEVIGGSAAVPSSGKSLRLAGKDHD